MKTAIDSSVLLTVFSGEADGRRWLELLMQARRAEQADRLAAVDRGYLRRYFTGLPLLQP